MEGVGCLEEECKEKTNGLLEVDDIEEDNEVGFLLELLHIRLDQTDDGHLVSIGCRGEVLLEETEENFILRVEVLLLYELVAKSHLVLYFSVRERELQDVDLLDRICPAESSVLPAENVEPSGHSRFTSFREASRSQPSPSLPSRDSSRLWSG